MSVASLMLNPGIPGNGTAFTCWRWKQAGQRTKFSIRDRLSSYVIWCGVVWVKCASMSCGHQLNLAVLVSNKYVRRQNKNNKII